ncbi:MAG TPA: spermidine/putrescine ABC transporter permease [Erysipelotrichaceae bacterium]|nr:ABC transporter permease [Bacillota bacterium]NLP21818.1 ABC transporter permease [Erysipelotrichaceae bacterium]HCY06946.1 spermidine/putrescine ABC transporter permease [Erysipelotrichaceae bacterium]
MKFKRLYAFLLRVPVYSYTISFIIIPLIYMLVLSFLTKAQTWGYTFDFTLANYERVFSSFYMGIFIESLKLALITTTIVLFVGYAYGYFMARTSDAWKRRLMILLMIPFWTSGLIRLNGWIIIFRSNGVLDKILMFFNIIDKPLKLLYSYPAVVIGMIYFLLPFMILSVFSSVEKMDWSLVEAARDLGATSFEAFKSITLVQTMPGILSGIVLTFVPSMGMFYVAEILGGNKIVLISNVISEQMTKGRNTPFAAALSVILMILTSIILSLYKKFTKTSELEGIL